MVKGRLMEQERCTSEKFEKNNYGQMHGSCKIPLMWLLSWRWSAISIMQGMQQQGGM
jgi:hypothetical protein